MSTTKLLFLNKYFYEIRKCYLRASYEEFVKFKYWKIIALSNVSYFTREYIFIQLNIGILLKDSSYILRYPIVQKGTFCLHFLEVFHIILKHISIWPKGLHHSLVNCGTQFNSLFTLVQPTATPTGNQRFTHHHQQNVCPYCLHKFAPYFLSFFFSEYLTCCSWKRGLLNWVTNVREREKGCLSDFAMCQGKICTGCTYDWVRSCQSWKN